MNTSRDVSNAVMFGLMGALIGLVLLLVFVFPVSPSQDASTDQGSTSSATQDAIVADADQNHSGDDAGSDPVGVNRESDQRQSAAAESGASDARQPAAQPEAVDARRAGQIAASHVGGSVDTVDREPDGDYGAAWDVDVYSPEGEYTVYISAAGEVVRVEGPFTD